MGASVPLGENGRSAQLRMECCGDTPNIPQECHSEKKNKKGLKQLRWSAPQHTYRTLDVCRLHSLLTREVYVLTACLLSFTVFVFLLFCLPQVILS